MTLKHGREVNKYYFISYSYTKKEGSMTQVGFGQLCIQGNMKRYEEIGKVTDKIKEQIGLDSVIILNFIEIEGL